MEPDLFRTEINENGIMWLKHLYRLSTYILITTILFNGVSVATTIYYILQTKYDSGMPASLHIRNLLFAVFATINFALQVTQIIFFKRFAVTARKALDAGESKLFNQSFRWLFLQAVCMLVQLAVSFFRFTYSYIAIGR